MKQVLRYKPLDCDLLTARPYTINTQFGRHGRDGVCDSQHMRGPDVYRQVVYQFKTGLFLICYLEWTLPPPPDSP